MSSPLGLQDVILSVALSTSSFQLSSWQLWQLKNGINNIIRVKITSKKDKIGVRSDNNKMWTKKDCEQVEYFLQRYEQVLEEAVDLRAQILRILNTRKTDFKNTIKVTERISEATDKFLGSIDNSDD
ncbi:MAG: hypothetical protein WA393_02345 [Nitrososphaeraceae archaeon]